MFRSIVIMFIQPHHENAPAHTALSVQQFLAKQHGCYHSSSLFTGPCAMRLFPFPSYERPDGRETFCWFQRSEKANAEGLEQYQHWKFPKMFSALEKKVGTSVSSQKESTLKETRVVRVLNLVNHLKKIIPVIFASPSCIKIGIIKYLNICP